MLKSRRVTCRIPPESTKWKEHLAGFAGPGCDTASGGNCDPFELSIPKIYSLYTISLYYCISVSDIIYVIYNNNNTVTRHDICVRYALSCFFPVELLQMYGHVRTISAKIPRHGSHVKSESTVMQPVSSHFLRAAKRLPLASLGSQRIPNSVKTGLEATRKAPKAVKTTVTP